MALVTGVGERGQELLVTGRSADVLGGAAADRLDECRIGQGRVRGSLSDAYGLKKLGVERLKPLFTRGHLERATSQSSRRSGAQSG